MAARQRARRRGALARAGADQASHRQAPHGRGVSALSGNKVPGSAVIQSTRAARDTSNNFRKLQAQLRGSVGKAIGDFRMIADGDRVMVCVSGGKDSYTLLDMLLEYLAALEVPFRIIE